MTENNVATKVSEKSATQIKGTSEKLGAAIDPTTRVIENIYASTIKGMKNYNLKALEFAQVNSAATFGYAQQLMSAELPSDVLDLCNTHARKQFEALTEQTKELAMLGQRAVYKTTKL